MHCPNDSFVLADIRRWQSYVEPGDEAEASSSPAKRVSRNLEMTSSTTTATSPVSSYETWLLQTNNLSLFFSRSLYRLYHELLRRNECYVNGTHSSIFQNGEADGDGVGGTGFGEDELLPLPENTLTRNLGLDLIVVVTKVNNQAHFSCFCPFGPPNNDALSASDGLHGRSGARLRLQGGAL